MMLQHHIDQVVIRDGQIFAYGWGFMPGAVVNRLSLRLEYESDPVEQIDAEYGRQRDDVQAAFPEVNEARNAGFMLLAGVGGRNLTRAVLQWDLDGLKHIETNLPLPKAEAQSSEISRFSFYLMLSRKAVGLMRTAGIKTLVGKATRYLSDTPSEADETTWAHLRKRLVGKPLCLIVDHDMGGGANRYRDGVVAQKNAEGEIVLLVSFHVASLQTFVEVFDGESSQRHTLAQLEHLMPLVAGLRVMRIIYNCAVSFRAPLLVPKLLVKLRQQTNASLLFLVHDYFALCPSHFLIDADGKFCSVPDPAECGGCLKRHRDGFVSLAGIRTIGEWRDTWGMALGLADEIRVFSESSKDLVMRAYPRLETERIQIVPHTLHTQLKPLEIVAGPALHIGVVGAVGRHKGAGIVAALAGEIQRRGTDVKITVIGTLEAKVPHDIVRVTGPYVTENLPVEVQKSGANVFLFPSICGETFSYTSHELIAMKLPFACFNFGAQAELARRYEKGLVLDSMNAAEILERLKDFWIATYHLKDVPQ